jgi:hypothetical protein
MPFGGVRVEDVLADQPRTTAASFQPRFAASTIPTFDAFA